MIQACIFDLDGVLVDTVGLHFESWQKLASSLGYELPLHLKNKFRGASRMKSLGYILNEFSIHANDNDKAKFCHLKNKWYQESLENINEDIMLEGAKLLLLELSKSNIKVALASASKNAKLIIQKLKLDNLFDAMVDANDVTQTKPNPEVFLSAANKINCQPSDCIVFEDSPLGVTAAQTGGFKSVGIGDEIEVSTVDFHFKNLEDIPLSDILKHFEN
jgi:beta-phosphoglucomutase